MNELILTQIEARKVKGKKKYTFSIDFVVTQSKPSKNLQKSPL